MVSTSIERDFRSNKQEFGEIKTPFLYDFWLYSMTQKDEVMQIEGRNKK